MANHIFERKRKVEATTAQVVRNTGVEARIILCPLRYYSKAQSLETERSNQSLVYSLLFRVSSAATQYLAKAPRFIGGQIGMVGILHIWGRNLAYHPHIHYPVPAGGLAADTQTWLPVRRDFLLPVKALSKIFRGKFRQALQKTALFKQIPAKVWQQEWVVAGKEHRYCKPVGNGRTALKCLASTRLVPGDMDPNTFLPYFRIAPDGFLDVQFNHIRRFDGGFDMSECLKFQTARCVG